MNFYRKLNPRTKFYLRNGRHVQFDTLDNQVGYYATDNGDVIREIEQAQRDQRGGITAITHEEYERDYAQKKRLSPEFRPKPLNREEIAAEVNTSDTLTMQKPSGNQEVGAGRAVRVALSGDDIEKSRKNVVSAPPVAAPVAPDAERPEPPPVRTKKTSAIKAAE